MNYVVTCHLTNVHELTVHVAEHLLVCEKYLLFTNYIVEPFEVRGAFFLSYTVNRLSVS